MTNNDGTPLRAPLGTWYQSSPGHFRCKTETRSGNVWWDAVDRGNGPTWRWSVFTRRKPHESMDLVVPVAWGEAADCADAVAKAAPHMTGADTVVSLLGLFVIIPNRRYR